MRTPKGSGGVYAVLGCGPNLREPKVHVSTKALKEFHRRFSNLNEGVFSRKSRLVSLFPIISAWVERRVETDFLA